MIQPNETAVLRGLVADAHRTNRSIADEIGLTSAGVGKIRARLERKGILRNYQADLDPAALGLDVHAILHLRVMSEGWSFRDGLGIQAAIASNVNITAMYRVPGREVTHILFCSFRNLLEFDRYLHSIRSQLSQYLEIVESFVFATDSIIKDTSQALHLRILDEGDDVRMPEPILFGRILGEDR